MKLGIGFPQNDIGSDPVAIRDYSQAAEGAGFDYLTTFEHVAGAHPGRFEGVDTGFPSPPYLHEHEFHEPFALFSYMAAFTSRIELATGVLVLPQRQTVLVAKQAAEVDILSGGRLRLGIGVGWNHAEFESLNEDFHTRGHRVEEQIEVMRRLWTEPLVNFEGRWHRIDRIAIAPRPSRAIPVWLGGGATDRLLRRAARLADGWIPNARLIDPQDSLPRLQRFLREQGRDPSGFGLQASIGGGDGGPDEWLSAAERWRSLGATHLSVGGARAASPKELLERAIRVKRVLEEGMGLQVEGQEKTHG